MKNPTTLSVVITSNILMNRMVRRRDRNIWKFAGRGVVTVPNNVEAGDPWNFSVAPV